MNKDKDKVNYLGFLITDIINFSSQFNNEDSYELMIMKKKTFNSRLESIDDVVNELELSNIDYNHQLTTQIIDGQEVLFTPLLVKQAMEVLQDYDPYKSSHYNTHSFERIALSYILIEKLSEGDDHLKDQLENSFTILLTKLNSLDNDLNASLLKNITSRDDIGSNESISSLIENNMIAKDSLLLKKLSQTFLGDSSVFILGNLESETNYHDIIESKVKYLSTDEKDDKTLISNEFLDFFKFHYRNLSIVDEKYKTDYNKSLVIESVSDFYARFKKYESKHLLLTPLLHENELSIGLSLNNISKGDIYSTINSFHSVLNDSLGLKSDKSLVQKVFFEKLMVNPSYFNHFNREKNRITESQSYDINKQILVSALDNLKNMNHKQTIWVKDFVVDYANQFGINEAKELIHINKPYFYDDYFYFMSSDDYLPNIKNENYYETLNMHKHAYGLEKALYHYFDKTLDNLKNNAKESFGIPNTLAELLLNMKLKNSLSTYQSINKEISKKFHDTINSIEINFKCLRDELPFDSKHSIDILKMIKSFFDNNRINFSANVKTLSKESKIIKSYFKEISFQSNNLDKLFSNKKHVDGNKISDIIVDIQSINNVFNLADCLTINDLCKINSLYQSLLSKDDFDQYMVKLFSFIEDSYDQNSNILISKSILKLINSVDLTETNTQDGVSFIDHIENIRNNKEKQVELHKSLGELVSKLKEQRLEKVVEKTNPNYEINDDFI